MVIWGVLTWWYREGWLQCIKRVEARLDATLDYFSFGLLVSTFFAPFRQISAGGVNGPLEVQARAFLDRLVSRLIGAAVRSIMIVVGSVAILMNVIVGIIFVIGWGLVPILPFIGLGLFILGWLPWSN